MQTNKTPRLAITVPELLVEGIPQFQVERIYAALQKTAARAPQLNNYPTLAALAKQLRFLPGAK